MKTKRGKKEITATTNMFVQFHWAINTIKTMVWNCVRALGRGQSNTFKRSIVMCNIHIHNVSPIYLFYRFAKCINSWLTLLENMALHKAPGAICTLTIAVQFSVDSLHRWKSISFVLCVRIKPIQMKMW